MTAGGSNVKMRFWRINYSDDNSVGGAVTTGTVIGDYPGRFQAVRESQLLLQQGLETERTFTAVVVPGTLDIRERDEMEILFPEDHPYHGDRFRIRSVNYSDFNPRDPRNYLMLGLSRSVRSHDRQ